MGDTVSIVTGAAGFIGSHLVDALVEQGGRVVAVDNLATGNLSNLNQARASGLVEFHDLDVNDTDGLKSVFSGADRIFHLAALADIVPSIEHPMRYFRANADGTASVMEAARDAGVMRVTYAASGSCYGIPDDYPTNELAEMRPQYPYALTKYLGEQIVLHWGQVYGISVISLRLSNVYGPRHRTSGAYGAVLGVFLAQRLAGKPLTIVGDGKQTRDFTYVSDVASAFIRASESDVTGEVMNVGSGGTYSVNELAELIGGPTVPLPKRPGEPDCTFADITKIKRLIDWEPSVKFKDGVAMVLEHIDDWSDAPVWTPDQIDDATRPWFEALGRSASGSSSRAEG